ncbi:tRNA 4-thiouridine(8) synthase ThiI [Candidatus Parcubacteria bacterium]|nr:tRNA 4-thiouridine(8) synthase ThiI [Candidatus Parcubacteria bacterium]
MKKGILIAFGELFLKSPPVQKLFKKKLLFNISFFLKKANLDFEIFSQRERIFLATKNTKKAQKIIKKIFGISWFTESLFFEKGNLKEISEFCAKNYQNWIKENETFAIRLKKGSEIRKSSQEIIKKIAEKIERKVDLEKPKREIFVEARKEGWFLYFKKKKGAGGLPVGVSGKVLVLISGGIDSPVSAFLMAKRGAENIWLHFHSFPLVSRASIEKVKELAKIFLNYQPKLKIYLVPFSTIQMEIRTKTLPKYRVLLYRRIMLKIAEKIAKKENCYAIATGESLGQVSSQTLPNIQIIEKAVSIPVLRPLIGMDKEEIINLAKKIKTYQISIKPQEDCCTLFTPKHATAKGNLKEIEKMEKKLNLKKLISQALKEVEILKL